MASLFCNPTSGFFYAQFYSSRHKPSRKTVPLRTSTKRVAERALSRLVDAYALGEYDPWVSLEVVEQLETVREGVDAYLNACNHLKPNTIRTYREIFGAFMRFVGPDFRLSKITVSRIEAWLQTTSTNDVTKRKYVRHLGYIFRFLVSRGEMDLDLSKLVPLRKIPEMAPKSMTREETERLLATIRRYANSSSCRRNVEWLADLVELNVHVGLRRGELLHLK